jgi:hypothetical protein
MTKGTKTLSAILTLGSSSQRLVLQLSYQLKERAGGFLHSRLELRRQRIEEAGIRLPRCDEALRLGLLEAQKLP